VATAPASASASGSAVAITGTGADPAAQWNLGSASLLRFMSANGNSNTYQRTNLIGELQKLPTGSLTELTKYFPKLIDPNSNPPVIGGGLGIDPSASDPANPNDAAKRAAMAGPAATADQSTHDPKAEALGKISKALKPFAENCFKNKFVMVLADQSETARIIFTDSGKTLVQVEEDKVSSWMVLPGASAQDSDETDADAEEWAKNFADHVGSMIRNAETDITMDPYASAPSNRPVKKLLRIYGNDKVFHVTISTGSKSPSTIKYSYVELQLPEEFSHFHIILSRPLN
jgi:hypothetical protein